MRGLSGIRLSDPNEEIANCHIADFVHMKGVERQRERCVAGRTQVIPAFVMGYCDADLVPVEFRYAIDNTF
jgi:hypothetical protein